MKNNRTKAYSIGILGVVGLSGLIGEALVTNAQSASIASVTQEPRAIDKHTQKILRQAVDEVWSEFEAKYPDINTSKPTCFEAEQKPGNARMSFGVINMDANPDKYVLFLNDAALKMAGDKHEYAGLLSLLRKTVASVLITPPFVAEPDTAIASWYTALETERKTAQLQGERGL